MHTHLFGIFPIENQLKNGAPPSAPSFHFEWIRKRQRNRSAQSSRNWRRSAHTTALCGQENENSTNFYCTFKRVMIAEWVHRVIIHKGKNDFNARNNNNNNTNTENITFTFRNNHTNIRNHRELRWKKHRNVNKKSHIKWNRQNSSVFFSLSLAFRAEKQNAHAHTHIK